MFKFNFNIIDLMEFLILFFHIISNEFFINEIKLCIYEKTPLLMAIEKKNFILLNILLSRRDVDVNKTMISIKYFNMVLNHFA